MWQFANLFQFILLFGKALKMDDNLDIEVCSVAATRRAASFAVGLWDNSDMSAIVGPRNGMPEAQRYGFARHWAYLP
jgi:hypothetical protein